MIDGNFHIFFLPFPLPITNCTYGVTGLEAVKVSAESGECQHVLSTDCDCTVVACPARALTSGVHYLYTR